MVVATDGHDGNGLNLEKVRPTFSSSIVVSWELRSLKLLLSLLILILILIQYSAKAQPITVRVQLQELK